MAVGALPVLQRLGGMDFAAATTARAIVDRLFQILGVTALDDVALARANEEILLANNDLRAAIARRNNAKKAGVCRPELNDAVAAAQAALNAAEVRLRTLYEAKGDWVPLSPIDRITAAPAPTAVG